VTNAIVLLDLVEQFRRKGMERAHGRDRGRPPPPSPHPHDRGGDHPGAHPDGARIGGLFTSTFLTLILVPVLYLVLDRLRPKRAADEADESWAETPATI